MDWKTGALTVLLLLEGPALGAATLTSEQPQIRATRASGPIAIDGELSDSGWRGATRVETWYETSPGDNVTPPVRSVGYVSYDEKFLYAGFEFFDPDPTKIRAPFGDRDSVPSSMDSGGIIVDTRHDGRAGILFLANPRGIQYDAVTDDTTTFEDSSPDFYWDAAAKITASGWVLEMRVPFSSLRYPKRSPQVWRILLYRNYPREFRYQMYTSKLPRGSNCFLCHAAELTGLEGLPAGRHLVVAPYATAKEEGVRQREPRASFANRPVRGNGGADLKWTPGENMAVDATVNPDFSQVESDVAQIGVNERFALFYTEKRPFFLEGVELFSTPISAVYTRSITSPGWGARVTGKAQGTGYTLLLSEDRGGGSVILPGPNGSGLADQDFGSFAMVARARHDLGSSFVSFLATDREISGGGYNRVYGPDFQWRTAGDDIVTGQFLLSHTENPWRPDLAAEWTGQRFDSHAAAVSYSHTTSTVDWATEYRDYGGGFRAWNGFVPQVGFRENSAVAGYTFRPTGFFSRVKTFVTADYQADTGGSLLLRSIAPGIFVNGRWDSSLTCAVTFDRVRSGDRTFPRRQLLFGLRISPSRAISEIAVAGSLGEDLDFANSRTGRGGYVTAGATLRPTDHLELRLDAGRRWLDVDAADGRNGRLFTATIAHLRAAYTFTSRAFFRGTLQSVRTEQDPSLYLSAVDARDGSLTGSALLAYKLNWQSVVFLGYGDSRTLNEEHSYERSSRQLFLKISYALQR